MTNTNHRVGRRAGGFSMIELLLVVAIIAILMAISMPIYSKAIDKAEGTAAQEGLRQKAIGKAAENANSVRVHFEPRQGREAAREAFRQTILAAGRERIVTQPLYVVSNDDEFRAYYHTLINPFATFDLEWDGLSLIAFDPEGNEYILPPVGVEGRYILAWDYVSTEARYMSTSRSNIKVGYNTGRVETLRYPGEFPATETVAKLSNDFARVQPE